MKNMRRFLPILFAVTLVLCAAIAASASADYIAGDTATVSSFSVQANTAGATVELNSYTGTASALMNGYQNAAAKEYYGFYTVTVTGDNYNRMYYWTPSKAVNLYNEYITSPKLSIQIPYAGRYTIQVAPFAPEQITACLNAERFNYWMDQADWVVGGEFGCTCFYPRHYDSLNVTVNCYDNNGNFLTSYTEMIAGDMFLNPRQINGYYCNDYTFLQYYPDAQTQDMYTVTFTYFRVSGKVAVYCYDEYGGLLDSYTETIYESQYIRPRQIGGYITMSSGEYVSLNINNRSCNPASIYFYYRSQATPTPKPIITPTPKPKPAPAPDPDPSGGSDPQITDEVKPSSWSTQFTERENKLYRLSDDDTETFFWWQIVDRERVDNIPELTAYFNNATISAIGIRSGRPKQYKNYARVRSFRVVIYHDGGVATVNVKFADRESVKSYHTASLGGTYQGVTKIELFLDKGTGEGFYPGTGSGKNYVYVKDIKFGR